VAEVSTYTKPTDEQLRELTPEAAWLALRLDPKRFADDAAGLAAELLEARRTIRDLRTTLGAVLPANPRDR